MRFNRSIHISAPFMLFGVVAAVQTEKHVSYINRVLIHYGIPLKTKSGHYKSIIIMFIIIGLALVIGSVTKGLLGSKPMSDEFGGKVRDLILIMILVSLVHHVVEYL